MVKRKIKPHYILLLPSLAGVCIFTVVPFINVIINSFRINGENVFCGMENYRMIFENEAFRLGAKNTIFFTVFSVTVVLISAMGLSFLLFHMKRLGHLFQTINLFPLTVPVTSVALFWTIMFDKQGIWNGIAGIFGRGETDWINSKYAIMIPVLIFAWKNIGFITLLWMIGLGSVPKQVYEAANLDGAGKMHMFFFISLPNLKQTVYISVIFLLVRTSQIYREAYIMAGDYPSENMYFLQHAFHNWFRSYDFGKLSAGAVIYSVIIVVMVLALRRLDETI